MLLKFSKGPQCPPPTRTTTQRDQQRAQTSASRGLWESGAKNNTRGVGTSLSSVSVQLGKPFLFYHHYYNYLILQVSAVFAGNTHKAAKKPTWQEGPSGLTPSESLQLLALALRISTRTPSNCPGVWHTCLGSLDSGSLVALFSRNTSFMMPVIL